MVEKEKSDEIKAEEDGNEEVNLVTLKQLFVLKKFHKNDHWLIKIPKISLNLFIYRKTAQNQHIQRHLRKR